MGVLQKDAELQTQKPRGIRRRIQAEGDDWVLSAAALRDKRNTWNEWKIELEKKALEEDRRLEARERVKMGKEDSSSRRRTEWERILDRSPFLKTAS